MAVPLSLTKRALLRNFRLASIGLEPLLQRRVVGVQLFQLGQQDLDILQLSSLFQ